MIVYEVLKKDHDAAKKLLEKIEETTERAGKTRQQLWGELSEALTEHKRLEEEYFYPRLESQDATRPITLEANEEHRLATLLLEELDAMDVTDEMWTAKFKVFKENVEHHIREEENEMFPLARKVLSMDEAKEIGEQIESNRMVPAGVGGSGRQGAAGSGSGSGEGKKKVARDDEE